MHDIGPVLLMWAGAGLAFGVGCGVGLVIVFGIWVVREARR